MITETYIEMCKQAKEIQELWKPEWGDMAHSILSREKKAILYLGPEPLEEKELYIWLPYQEQLQEMVNTRTQSEYQHDYGLSSVFYMFMTTKFTKQTKFFSLNEWWLMFVMDKKFNKTWDFDKKEWG